MESFQGSSFKVERQNPFKQLNMEVLAYAMWVIFEIMCLCSDLSQFILFKWQLNVLLSFFECLIIKVLTFDVIILD
jgi:hypothetical protein